MKVLTLLSMMVSWQAFGKTEGLYNLECKNPGATKVFILVIQPSEREESRLAEEPYDRSISTAPATVGFARQEKQYRYSKNVYVIDEGQGNFRLTALAFSVNSATQVATVADIYYDDETKTVSGYIKRPKYEQDSGQKILVDFVPGYSFNQLPCREL